MLIASSRVSSRTGYRDVITVGTMNDSLIATGPVSEFEIYTALKLDFATI